MLTLHITSITFQFMINKFPVSSRATFTYPGRVKKNEFYQLNIKQEYIYVSAQHDDNNYFISISSIIPKSILIINQINKNIMYNIILSINCFKNNNSLILLFKM